MRIAWMLRLAFHDSIAFTDSLSYDSCCSLALLPVRTSTYCLPATITHSILLATLLALVALVVQPLVGLHSARWHLLLPNRHQSLRNCGRLLHLASVQRCEHKVLLWLYKYCVSSAVRYGG